MLKPMKLMSVNVSRPIEVQHGEKMVRTGIFKRPVTGPVRVNKSNLEGDGQADLENHGGEHKAVYAYSFDHYTYWREVLKREEMPYGQFGENLTVSGLDESQSCVGDQLQIGSALFTITQPRVPCFKLGIRLGDEKMPRMFSESMRTGFYLKVLSEGVIEAGDTVNVRERGHGEVAISALFEAYLKPREGNAARTLMEALEVPELSPEWRAHITKRLRHGQDGAS
jgi:MOSC domain-containing protein YiiM